MGRLQAELFIVGARPFRRLFIAGLQAALGCGDLGFFHDLAPLAEPASFALRLRALRQSPLIVYAKPPFGGTERMPAYLALYTHRAAIGNSRLVDVTDAEVAFRYKNCRRGGRSGVIQLGAQEFLRRFLLHLLPDGFHRIRHHGFLAKGDRSDNLARLRELSRDTAEPNESAYPGLQAEKPEADARHAAFASFPDCGGLMRRIEIVTPAPTGAFRCDTS